MAEEHLKRELGLLQATMMGIGGAISAGVFVTLGYAASLAGTALLIAMILCGVINLFTMLSYAELGAAIPSAGGEYTFAKVSFGGFISFVTGWFEWISNMFYAAFCAVGFAYMVSYTIQAAGLPLTASVPIIAAVTVAVFAIINVKGIRETGGTQTLMVVVLLGILSVFTIWGLITGQRTGPLQISAAGDFLGLLRASAFIFVVYLGGEAIAVAQAEIKDPCTNIPRAILLTCLVLIAIYTSIAFVVFRIVPPGDLAGKESPLAYVAEQFMGPLGAGVVTVAGSIAALSSVNTAIMAQSRVAYALARDGYFPRVFYRIHKDFGTPCLAIAAGAILIAATAATGVVNFVAYAADFGFMVGFICVNLSLIRLRMRKPNLRRPFRVPLYPLPPVLGIVTSALLMLFIEPGTLLIGIELFILGLIVYCIRMVRYYRICLAAGGMNFGVSAFSALLALIIALDPVAVPMPHPMALVSLGAAVFVSVAYFIAGLLNITEEKGRAN